MDIVNTSFADKPEFESIQQIYHQKNIILSILSKIALFASMAELIVGWENGKDGHFVERIA